MEPGQEWVIFVVIGFAIGAFLVKLAAWSLYCWGRKKLGMKPPPDDDAPEL